MSAVVAVDFHIIPKISYFMNWLSFVTNIWRIPKKWGQTTKSYFVLKLKNEMMLIRNEMKCLCLLADKSIRRLGLKSIIGGNVLNALETCCWNFIGIVRHFYSFSPKIGGTTNLIVSSCLDLWRYEESLHIDKILRKFKLEFLQTNPIKTCRDIRDRFYDWLVPIFSHRM